MAQSSCGETENKSYLMNVGKIHLYKPYCFGGARRLPPGSSIQNDSQTSPSTFAYDVKMSAKITSEKYTRWLMGDDMHRLILLRSQVVRERHRENHKKSVQRRTKTYRKNASRSSFCMTSYGEIIHIRTTSEHTDGICLEESTRKESLFVAERYNAHAAEHHRPYQRARR